MDGAGPETGIEVVEPAPSWPARFAEIESLVRAAVGATALGVEHVGSTAVPGLAAKPIIDVDLTVPDPADEAAYVPQLEEAGFALIVREPWWHEHRCLRLADPRCNLHVFGTDSPELVRHRILRDWLRDHPDERDLYARTKRDAAAAANQAGEHVMQYNARKQDVVRAICARAFADRLPG